ncbi:MAG: hypothetical protein WC406_07550 [Methanoregula sp.]
MSAIDLDPTSNSREIPNVPAAKYYTVQDNEVVQRWVGRVYLYPRSGPVSSGGFQNYTRSGLLAGPLRRWYCGTRQPRSLPGRR